jgi:hypothetical protein
MDGLGHGSQPYFSTLLAYHTSTRVCGMNARPHQATALPPDAAASRPQTTRASALLCDPPPLPPNT